MEIRRAIFGMQHDKTADEMSDWVVDGFISFFGDKFKDYSTFNLEEEPYKEFSIDFLAYNYFVIEFDYERGSFGCSIRYGEHSYIPLPNSQEWFDKADFQVFCEELQKQLELRIPDKFLKANGWLR